MCRRVGQPTSIPWLHCATSEEGIMNGLLQDFRYALRQWRRSPGFTAIAMMTLALGIGPNVAIFSVIWAVSSLRFPIRSGNQLVVIWTNTKGERNPCRADDYLQYLTQSKSFQHLDFFSCRTSTSESRSGGRRGCWKSITPDSRERHQYAAGHGPRLPSGRGIPAMTTW